MIETDRNNMSDEIKKLDKESVDNWFNLANFTIKYLIEYAYKHPDIDIVFKGKWGVHSLEDLPIMICKAIVLSYTNFINNKHIDMTEEEL